MWDWPHSEAHNSYSVSVSALLCTLWERWYVCLQLRGEKSSWVNSSSVWKEKNPDIFSHFGRWGHADWRLCIVGYTHIIISKLYQKWWRSLSSDCSKTIKNYYYVEHHINRQRLVSMLKQYLWKSPMHFQFSHLLSFILYQNFFTFLQSYSIERKQ